MESEPRVQHHSNSGTKNSRGGGESQQPIVLTFIDVKKAFTSIHWGKIMKILRVYGIPPRLVQAMEATYPGTKARIITPKTELLASRRGYTCSILLHHSSRREIS